MDIDYDYLRRLRQDEQGSMALTPLPDDFYDAVREYVKEIKNRVGMDPCLDNMREYENLIKTLNDIVRLRLNKVILRSLHHQENTDNLTREEKELYINIEKVIKSYELSLIHI